jgi:hypothetical protein
MPSFQKALHSTQTETSDELQSKPAGLHGNNMGGFALHFSFPIFSCCDVLSSGLLYEIGESIHHSSPHTL